MKISRVRAVYFSPTGNTESVVKTIAGQLAEELDVSLQIYDFTLPENREEVPVFKPDGLIVFGMPDECRTRCFRFYRIILRGKARWRSR